MAKLGLLLHPERGIDAVFQEAQLADEQGYDSIWLGDHIMAHGANATPDLPFDSLTLMIGLGTATNRVRLAWSMLNVNFRYPAMLAKVLSTLDQMTKGRVICTLGSGSVPAEHKAYDIPIVEDHDGRVAFTREVVMLLKELWTPTRRPKRSALREPGFVHMSSGSRRCRFRSPIRRFGSAANLTPRFKW